MPEARPPPVTTDGPADSRAASDDADDNPVVNSHAAEQGPSAGEGAWRCH